MGALLDMVLPPYPDDAVIARIPEQHLIHALTSGMRSDGDVLTVSTLENPLVHMLITGLKYRRQMRYAKLMGVAARQALAGKCATDQWVVVPVPASVAGMRERGYNQSALIAKEIAQRASFRYFPALTRTDKRKAQTAVKTAAKRAENMHLAFVATTPHSLRGASYIVIDDVRTTGATLREAKRALKASGAGQVLCLAIAQAPLR